MCWLGDFVLGWSIIKKKIWQETNLRTKTLSKKIVATRLLYNLQYPVLYLIRLQRVYHRKRSSLLSVVQWGLLFPNEGTWTCTRTCPSGPLFLFA